MLKNFVDRYPVQIFVGMVLLSCWISYATYSLDIRTKASFASYEAEKAAIEAKMLRTTKVAEQKNQEYLRNRERR